jgi:pimeloyl-ACP methyl ester carboxylesterase
MTEPHTEDFLEAQAETLSWAGVEAEDRFVDLESLQGAAHVLVAGDGPPLVMLNGIGTPAVMWAPLMSRLSGFRIHAIDLPGYGLTDPPPERPADIRAHAVAFIEGALDGLGLERPAIVGNSLGSLWAMWTAIERSERIGPMVHVGCPALAPGTSAPLPMRLLSTRAPGATILKVQRPSPRQVRSLSRVVNQHPLPPEIASAILATERMPAFERTFRWNLRALLRLRGASPRYAITLAQLRQISQRTLLIFARQDPMGSEPAGRRMGKAMPGAELRICEGGHSPWLNEPERIARWIEAFLKPQVSPG